MAKGSRKGSASTSRKRTTTSKRNNKKNNSGLMNEIVFFILVGISILLFLGTCGLLGRFGEIIRHILIGIFGMVGYLFPFAFLFAVSYFFRGDKFNVAKSKIISTFVVMWVLSSFAQLIFAKNMVINSMRDYYTDSAKNGGFIGGATTNILCKFLGMAGTVVVLLVVLIICIVLLTDRSLYASFKDGSRFLADDYKRNAKYRKEMSEIRDIERKEREMQRSHMRNLRHQERSRRLEEKQAAQLEERRKRAEEKTAQTAERIRFDVTDFKRQQREYEAVNDAAYGDEEDFTATSAEIESVREPESIFYGNSQEYISTVREQTIETASSVAKIMEESAGTGLLSATKLERPALSGDMTEITENYCADDEFFDYINNSFQTSHKISINPEDEVERAQAYERDIPVDETEYFSEDYSDVTDLFSRRNSVRNSMEKENAAPIADAFEPDLEDYVETEESPYEASQTVTPQHKLAINTTDINEENAKPQPVSNVASAGKAVRSSKSGRYKMPPVSLLDEVKASGSAANAANELNETAMELKDTLKTFGLDVNIVGSSRGPAVTRFEVQMPAGVSVKKITNLADDIMMSLGAKDIRIEAPIPGKKAVGIELPNRESTMVHFKELIDSRAFKTFDSKVAFGVGKDLSGDIVVSDIAKMPHVLIAGATGSGKSVCINTLIMSILFKAKPDEVKLIMIDPKMVELSVYNDIPHLLIPVVTDPKKASAALSWAVNEMTNRYQRFAEAGVRDMKGFNSKLPANDPDYMPQIVIVVDELADLMMVAGKEVEESICRLAQLARAAGIYLILATQRPSVDVITGLIKANMPSRIAFSVTSVVDSRTILDQVGAERLLGYGDMLFFPRGYNKPSRVQGAFVSDDEVLRVVDYIKAQTDGNVYDEEAMNSINNGGASQSSAAGSGGLVDPQNAFDELFVVAGHAVIESDKASIGMLQRKFKIGFNRAARIMDQLSDEGVVGPEEGTKPRKILMSMEQFNQLLEDKNHS